VQASHVKAHRLFHFFLKHLPLLNFLEHRLEGSVSMHGVGGGDDVGSAISEARGGGDGGASSEEAATLKSAVRRNRVCCIRLGFILHQYKNKGGDATRIVSRPSRPGRPSRPMPFLERRGELGHQMSSCDS